MNQRGYNDNLALAVAQYPPQRRGIDVVLRNVEERDKEERKPTLYKRIPQITLLIMPTMPK